ncbi:MAG: hypothetical protein WDW38_004419 [Sanguina aurantia]
MFEARLPQASVLKKIVDVLKELVKECNFEISSEGIKLQAMDQSHVCLVTFQLRADGFEEGNFRCDKPGHLGINVENLQKILKCAGNEDALSLKADDGGDVLTLMFESSNRERISDFDLKLMSIDTETLDIPDQEYASEIKMPSTEYQRICRDLGSIGDTVAVSTSKEGVKFSTQGDVGTANITCRHSTASEKDDENVTVLIAEPVCLTFALRYLNNFAKATSLSPCVRIGLSKDVPVSVEYLIGDLGYMKFFLAPKIEEDDEVKMEGDE